jgi:glutaredoxin
MDIQMYSRNACNDCAKTKRIFLFKGLPFTEIKLGRDMTSRDEFMKEILSKSGKKVTSLPQVFIDGKLVGDLKATARFFNLNYKTIP